MKSLALTLVALATLATIGCGKKDETPVQAAQPCTQGTACKVVLKAEDAKPYFSKFLYNEKAVCADKTLKFSWLTMTDRLVVAKTTDGDDILADIQLFLTDDGNYTGFYQEKTVKRGEEGVTLVTAINNKKDLKGTWSVQTPKDQDPQLAIDGFGSGLAVNSRGWPGVQFTLPKDEQINPTLAEKSISFIAVRSNTSKDGKTADQACTVAGAQ